MKIKENIFVYGVITFAGRKIEENKQKKVVKIRFPGWSTFSTTEQTNMNTSTESQFSFHDLSVDLSLDEEMEKFNNSDELPSFNIRSMSPFGRSPSPISEQERAELACSTPPKSDFTDDDSMYDSSPEYVTLHDINAQISPLSTSSKHNTSTKSLETIFEGQFLQTPPRKARNGNLRMLKLATRNSFGDAGSVEKENNSKRKI